MIEDYQKFNILGFKKINKKFDKNFYCQLGKEWFDSHVVGSDLEEVIAIEHLIGVVEKLFASELERGDTKKAMARDDSSKIELDCTLFFGLIADKYKRKYSFG